MVWASLGPLFATLGGFLRGLLFLLKLQLGTLEPPHWSRGAPNRSPGGPNSPTRHPHDEVDGPTRPPKLIWRRVRGYVPEIWITKSKEKRKQETSSRPLRGDFAAVQFRASLSFLICFSCSALSPSSSSASSPSSFFFFFFFFCFSFFSFALSFSILITIMLRLRLGTRLELRLKLRRILQLRLRLGLRLRLRLRQRLRLGLTRSLRN